MGGNGFLHWGWNIWTQPEGNPVTRYDHVDTFNGSTNGDPFLVRPNKAALDVYDSMRSEALLAGIQDYELLTQLAATKPVLARALTSSVITNTTETTTSGAELDSDTAANWDTVSAVPGRAYGDVAASVDVSITGVNADGGETNWAGLTVHTQNPTDRQAGYLVGLRNNGEVFVDRSAATIAKAKVPGYTAGQTVILRAVTRGSTLKVYAGSTELISLTDASYPVGNVGLATGAASAWFDNVRLNPGTNPVEGAAVTASSSYENDGWSKNALTDGRRSLPTGTNGWSSIDNLSVDHTESVTAGLGAARRISRLDLFGRADGANTGLGFPVDFTVQVSSDNATWTTVADKHDYPRPGAGAQTFPFTPTTARYVKVTGTKLSADQFGDRYMQLGEIAVG
ncbi:discoidin domain-containing protein [Streptomyces sp. NBC_00454]